MKFINSKFKSVRTYMFIMDLERNEAEIVNTNLDQKDIFTGDPPEFGILKRESKIF